jgi:hypothetical protein
VIFVQPYLTTTTFIYSLPIGPKQGRERLRI